MRRIASYATVLLAGSLFIVGCATKGYVKKSVDPVDQKVDQVDKRAKDADAVQTANLAKTNSTLEEDERKLSATDEIAKSADTTAKSASGKADQNTRDLGTLRGAVSGVVANIDDYKPVNEATVVHFRVNKDTLTKDEIAKLDTVADQAKGLQRYFITVAGYTDQTGSASYNDQLSRNRANQVISYLVGSHDIPVYRIHMVGLGKQKLIDDGKGRKAREASRRVEITVFSAPPLALPASAGGN